MLFVPFPRATKEIGDVCTQANNLLGYVFVTLRSDYNVEESLLFLSTFLQLNVIKMLTVQ